MKRRRSGFGDGIDEPSIPMPKKDDKEMKYMVSLGGRAFVFESEEEAKAFTQIIRKRVTVEDAYEHIKALRAQGYFGSEEDSHDDEKDDRDERDSERPT